jgi:hypothetical protein
VEFENEISAIENLTMGDLDYRIVAIISSKGEVGISVDCEGDGYYGKSVGC